MSFVQRKLMTKEEALQEAQRRWGIKTTAVGLDHRSMTYYVIHGGISGSGYSWESAFADADQKGLE